MTTAICWGGRERNRQSRWVGSSCGHKMNLGNLGHRGMLQWISSTYLGWNNWAFFHQIMKKSVFLQYFFRAWCLSLLLTPKMLLFVFRTRSRCRTVHFNAILGLSKYLILPRALWHFFSSLEPLAGQIQDMGAELSWWGLACNFHNMLYFPFALQQTGQL